MQTVFPGERRLKRRLMRQMWKEMLMNLIKRIFGSKPGKAIDKDLHDSKKKIDDSNH